MQLQKHNKIQVSMGAIGTPNLNGDIFEMSYAYRSLFNRIRLAAMTLYISGLGRKCSKCSCEKYLVKKSTVLGDGINYYTILVEGRCLQCGLKVTINIVLDKEKAPDVQRNR